MIFVIFLSDYFLNSLSEFLVELLLEVCLGDFMNFDSGKGECIFEMKEHELSDEFAWG